MTRKVITDVDKHLARRLRQRRMEMNLTHETVGAVCGVGCQQAQRYETAGTPISAAKLWQIAILLGVPIDYFFEDARSVMEGDIVRLKPDIAHMAAVSSRPAGGKSDG